MTNHDKYLFDVLVDFGQLYLFLEKINKKFTKENGLNLTSVAILFYLQNHSNVANRKLAIDLGQDYIRVSKRVRRLYELGLLTQTTDKNDRRFVKLSLTNKGQAKLEKLEALMKKNSSVNTDVSEIIHLITQLSDSADNLNKLNLKASC